MSFVATSARHRLGQFETDAGLAIYDCSAVIGVGLSWNRYAGELWYVLVELSLGPLVLWVRICHYRTVEEVDK